jgi:hypothetical protein
MHYSRDVPYSKQYCISEEHGDQDAVYCTSLDTGSFFQIKMALLYLSNYSFIYLVQQYVSPRLAHESTPKT